MKALDLLVQIQTQQAKNHEDLVKAVNNGFERMSSTMAAHALDDVKQFAAIDHRLLPVENTRRTLRWAVASVFVQFLAFVFVLAAYALHVR